jgi:tetratricopeptide (TPR) repeat protein
VDLLAQEAWILSALDRPEEALAVAQAASLSPADPGTGQEGFAVREVCGIQMQLGHYAAAVAACERSAAIDDWWADQATLAAAYAQLGDTTRAAAAKAALLKLKPDFTIEKLRSKFTGTPDALQRADTHVYDGMRKAGLPEQ